MNSSGVGRSFPCSTFFSEGRWGAGVAALLMQASIVLWPAASRWAHQSQERESIEKMLNELSETHCTAQVKYRENGKRFRQVA